LNCSQPVVSTAKSLAATRSSDGPELLLLAMIELIPQQGRAENERGRETEDGPTRVAGSVLRLRARLLHGRFDAGAAEGDRGDGACRAPLTRARPHRNDDVAVHLHAAVREDDHARTIVALAAEERLSRAQGAERAVLARDPTKNPRRTVSPSSMASASSMSTRPVVVLEPASTTVPRSQLMC